MRSIKDECLDRMVLFNEKSLHDAVEQYVEHYHCERNHQGLDSRILRPEFDAASIDGEIACRERLGGMLNYYHRRAA